MSKSKSKSSVSWEFMSNASTIEETIKNDGPNAVYLLIYDMSHGRARIMPLLQLGGDRVEGIWHVGVYVFGREWGYSSKGISEFPPLKDRDWRDYPDRMERIGDTYRSFPEFKNFIKELRGNLFQAYKYHILNRNCIIFSHILCKILCGLSIPKYLLDLPTTVMMKPLMLMLTNIFGVFVAAYNQAKARKLATVLDGVPPSQMLSFLEGLPKTYNAYSY